MKPKLFTNILILILFLHVLSSSFLSSVYATDFTITNPYVSETNTYKGQVHNHTNFSDGDSSPQIVVTNYKNDGYKFISLTDHMLITSNPNVSGILFIPGAEQNTTFGHIGRLNAKSAITKNIPSQDLINEISNEGSIAIINHPNLQNMWTTASFDAVTGYVGIEIYNSMLHSAGDSVANAEDKWDYVLSQGKKVWGFAGDDCHKQISPLCRTTYLRVSANSLTTDEITNNIKNGNFYSGYTPHGNTDILLSISTSGKTITATTNISSTIEFIAKGGTIKKTESQKTSSSYTPVGNEGYIRIRATNGQTKAWSNPLFLEIAFLAGDINHDNNINMDDYNILVTNFGKTGTAGFIPSDIDKNGKVDIFDYNTLVTNYTK